jgi:hypothetical protein
VIVFTERTLAIIRSVANAFEGVLQAFQRLAQRFAPALFRRPARFHREGFLAVWRAQAAEAQRTELLERQAGSAPPTPTKQRRRTCGASSSYSARRW